MGTHVHVVRLSQSCFLQESLLQVARVEKVSFKLSVCAPWHYNCVPNGKSGNTAQCNATWDFTAYAGCQLSSSQLQLRCTLNTHTYVYSAHQPIVYCRHCSSDLLLEASCV